MKTCMGRSTGVLAISHVSSCDFPFVNADFEVKTSNPNIFASGGEVRDLSESNRCLKNHAVRDLSECVT